MLLADETLDLSGLAALGKRKKFDFKKKGPIAAIKAFNPSTVMKATKPIVKAGPIKAKKALVGRDEKSKAMRKEMRSAYVETVLKSQAAMSPSFEKHYEFEQRRNRVRALQSEAAQTTDPERLRQIEQELVKEAREQEKYLKGGKVVASLFSIVGTVFPVLQLVSAAIALGVRAVTAQDQEAAQKQLALAEERAVQEMIAMGMTDAQARQVIGLLKSGVEAQTALLTVLQSQPQESQPQESKPMPTLPPVYQIQPMPPAARSVVIRDGDKLPPDEAVVQFLYWLQEWRPDYYRELVARQPEVLDVAAGQPTGLAGYDDWGLYDPHLAGLGEIDWGGIINGISSAVSSIGKSYFDTQMMRAQLEQVKNGQAPLPTSQAQQVAQQRVQAAGQAGVLPSWVMPVSLGAGALIIGYLLFGGRRRARG